MSTNEEFEFAWDRTILLADHGFPLAQDYISTAESSSHVTALARRPKRSRANLMHKRTKVREELQLARCARRRQRNARTAISRLPIEIITTIFLLLAHEFRPRSGKWWNWLVLTKVCGAWRDIALGCPTLWITIRNFTPVDMLHAFLERSGNAALFVELDMRSKAISDGNCLEILRFEMCRVRELKVTYSLNVSDSAWRNLRRCLSWLTERTKILSILQDGAGSQAYAGDWAVGNLAFPLGGADGVEWFPVRPAGCRQVDLSHLRLQKLTIRGVRTPWNSAVFYRLIELRICDIPEDLWPSMEDIIYILEHCRNLKDLILDDVGPKLDGWNNHDNSRFKIIDVPKLRRFGLLNVACAIPSTILGCVSLSKDAFWQISLAECSIEELQEGLLKLIGERAECDNIEIKVIDDEISIDTSLKTPDGRFVKGSLGLPLYDVGDAFDVDWLQSALQAIFSQAYYCDSTRTVVQCHDTPDAISECLEVGAEIWSILLEVLPQATECLSILLSPDKKYCPSDVIEAMTSSTEQDPSADVCLPHLKKILIRFGDFSSLSGKSILEAFKAYIAKRNKLLNFECQLTLEKCKLEREEGDEEDDCDVNLCM